MKKKSVAKGKKKIQTKQNLRTLNINFDFEIGDLFVDFRKRGSSSLRRHFITDVQWKKKTRFRFMAID